MIDGRPAVMLPRAPSEAGASPETDILAAVRGGEPLKWDGPVSGSSATAVCLFPLPHGSTLRFVVVSPSVVVDSSRFDVAALPDSAAVSRGWTAAVDTAGRYRFPDDGVHRLAGAARARLIVEADGLGDRVVTGAEGAGIVLRGLAAGGHATECLPVLATFAQSFPTRLVGSPSGAADILAGIAAGAAVVDSSELTDALLEPAAQLAKLIERSGHGPSRFTAYSALAALAAQAGQAEAVADLVGRADAVAPPKSSPPTLDELTACAQAAAPAGRWQSADNPATGQRGGADDAGMAARFWLLARRMLLEETESAVVGGGVHVELLAGFPTAWRGGTVEVHGAPVADHRLSYAIRWHGHRPALLWEVTAGRSTPPPVLRCRSLDPDWVGDELSGETLLGGTADELPKAPEVGDSFQ